MTELIEGVVLAPDAWTPEQAASYITEAWQKAVGSIVETGQRLIEVKERAGHGNWLPTVDLLPFSERTAQVLMKIARHPDLSNAHHDAHLPASYNTLGILAQLPPGEIPRRIEAREITPELDRATAQEWASVYQQAKQESLNAYNMAVDGLTRALSYAKTYEPPANMPASYLPPADFTARVKELLSIAENWSTE